MTRTEKELIEAGNRVALAAQVVIGRRTKQTMMQFTSALDYWRITKEVIERGVFKE